jgi:hypothetical protein
LEKPLCQNRSWLFALEKDKSFEIGGVAKIMLLQKKN